MTDLRLNANNSYSNIVDEWLRKEKEGDKYPVDFNVGWRLAGYSTKANAKRKLSKFSQGIDFILSDEMVKRPQGGGAKSEVINLTCDAFKHFCFA